MAIATAAGAADSITGVTFSVAGGIVTQTFFGQGASGSFDVNGTFAGDGGNVSVTTNAPGVTFTVTNGNTSASDITGDFSSTSATVPGSYNITVTDNGGTATDTGAFTVYGDPTVTSAVTGAGASSIPSLATPTAVPITINGAGFISNGGATHNLPPQVYFTSTVDGTTLTTGTVTGGGATETTPATTLGVPVTATNSVTHAPATPGTYTVTVVNPDGGSFTSGPIFTVVGNEITTVSPSALAVPATGSTTTTVTIVGGGFQSGATVTPGTCAGVTQVAGSTTVTSSSTITTQFTVASGTAFTRCDLTVANSAVGDNQASYTAKGALGIGEGSSLAPMITASSLTSASALLAGAPSTTITFTGQGFSPYTTPTTSTDAQGNPDAAAAITGPCLASSAGTSLTCTIAIASGVTAGAHTANLDNTAANAATMGSFANAFTVDGPSVTAATPPALAAGAAIGTVVNLTGTGFNNTTTGVVAHNPVPGTGVLNGVFQFVSATSENFVVTTSPTTADNGDTLQVTTTNAYGAAEKSIPFAIGVNAAPTESSVTYAAGTTGVGVGATAQTVTINGTGFQSGATVTKFTNASGAADANVTAKVTAVNQYGTALTVSIAIAAGDTNTIDGFTVTNPDGGTATALAVAPAGLVIDAAPTVTAVSPSTATPSATNAFTLTGTGFQAGAVVTASSNGTCGVATVASATSLTVSCTLGAAGTSDVTLVVTNPDGGTATSATVLPAQTAPPKPTFHVSAVHGVARHGKTVTLLIVGTGFYGQPKITSNAKGVRAVVAKDNGKVLTVRVTTPMNVRGWHTFTVRLANGKSGKVNYRTV
ncbi:MAG TPA: IPT/TIG domain-containing protein [Acidimicrobiales bacterium]|nr:IPT/TIG domain-containing protein [Acidimicrobiales bacterium]